MAKIYLSFHSRTTFKYFGVVLCYIKGMGQYLYVFTSSMTYREKKPGLKCKKSKTKRDSYCKELIKKISAV